LKDYLGDPAYPDDYWQTATFAESNLEPLLFQQALAKIAASGWEIHSFLVARNGRLVLERYGWKSRSNPADPDQTPHQVLPSERHLVWSTTKSFTSALVGIAISEGLISGVDHKVADWFSDYASLNPTPDKSLITLEDLLTMRSGLEFVEGETAVFDTPDPARAMLARTVVSAPGTVWNYSTGGSDIIAEILRITTGATPLEYANVKLFGPLGIVNPPWAAGQSGTNHGGFGLALTTREMARLGELFRNFGVWAKQQIIPADWTITSTTAHCWSAWNMQYAYHWWLPNLPGFFAAIGAYGQEIFVSRETGLVMVFTADLPSDVANADFESIIRDYVIPAIR
jgi:CubicO group peptidase (beta-lactamase class C family)